MKTYSQWGEDRLVWEYFQRKPHGLFAEVGANDPIHGSQTYLLEQNGWEGILVEPQAECCERLREFRKKSTVFQAACGSPAQRGKASFHVASSNARSSLQAYQHDQAVTFCSTVEVEVRTLDDLLTEAGHQTLDFLSIDVEGTELDVLKGIDLSRWKPKLVIVEDYVFTLDVHHHLTANGYKLVKRTGSNNWYVPRGCAFPLATYWERVKLMRKMYLGTPLRQLKLRLRRKKCPPQ